MEREFECRVTEKSVSFPLAPNLSPRLSSQFQFVIIFPFLVDDEENFLRLYFRGELGPLSGISKQYHDGGGKKNVPKKASHAVSHFAGVNEQKPERRAEQKIVIKRVRSFLP